VLRSSEVPSALSIPFCAGAVLRAPQSPEQCGAGCRLPHRPRCRVRRATWRRDGRGGPRGARRGRPYPRAAYSFTSAPIAKALIDAHTRRVQVLAVLDTSKGYRVQSGQDSAGMRVASVVPFATEGEAQQAGYRRAKDCP
jgi:hypothetical protein